MGRVRTRTAWLASRTGRFLLLSLICGLLAGIATAETPASGADSKQSARAIFQAGLAAARSNAKAGFFEVSSPGCGWCRRMNQLFGSGEAAEVLRKYYVYIPVDLADHAGTADLARTLGRKNDTGSPWFAVVDPAGKTLATSDAPGGNIGFPGNDEERAAFLAILRQTAKGISAEELALVENSLKAAVAKPVNK